MPDQKKPNSSPASKENEIGDPQRSTVQEAITLVSPMDRTPRPKNSSATQFTTGDLVDDTFELKTKIGNGGMSEVYSAVNIHSQERVAIKLISESFSQHPHAFSALIREAEKTMTLDHPNVVNVISYGGDQENYAYLVMELLEGFPLNKLLQQGHTSYLQSLEIIQQFANGLAHAHSKGIIHADLKPANLFLTNNNKLKILDFGISRAVNEDLRHEGFDVAKLKALTLQYASPEMLRYEAPHESDDVFAFGIIACELMMGTHPFCGMDALTALNEQLGFNSSSLFSSLKNKELMRYLEKCINLERKSRYTSIQKFLQDFEKIHFNKNT